MVDLKKMFGNRVYIISATTFVALMAFLSLIPGLTIECEDKVCDGLHCEVYCDVTNKGSRSVYLYNKGDWTMDFSPDVKNFDLYVKYYGKWKFTNFTMETRLGNIPDDRLYVFVFPRYSKKEFKLIVDMHDADRIKYTFGSLDPILIGYQYIYENLSKQVPIYKDKVIQVPLIYNALNKSWEGGYEYTVTELKGYKTEYYSGERIGIKAGGKEYLGYVNLKDEYVSQWNVPIGDRDFDEFGRCRGYEMDRGVCDEVNLLK